MGDVFGFIGNSSVLSGAERHTGRSLRFRCCVDSFIRTGYIRNVAGGRLPPLRSRWGVVPFNHTGSSHYVSGTAHRPFPTVSLVGGFFRPHRLYLQRGGRLVAAPTGVIPFIRPGYIRNVPGTAHRPFPTVSLVGGFFHPHRLSLQRIGRHTGSILWGAFYTVEHLSGFV